MGEGGVTYPLFINYVYILNFIFMRLLLHVKKEIKKEFNMLPFLLHFYSIHQTMKTQSQCKRSYTLTFIGPGLFDTGDDWLRMMGVISKDYMHLKGENKHFLIYSMIF